MTYTFVTVLFLSMTIIDGGRFPRVFRQRANYPQRVRFHEQPLRLHDGDQYFMPYVNVPYRKTYQDDDLTPLLPKSDSLENLFDNGMIILTLPRDNEDRELNRLVNNIIYKAADLNERGVRNSYRDIFRKKMRNNLYKINNKYDLDDNDVKDGDTNRKNLEKNILRTNNNLDLVEQQVTPKHVFDFNDIVG